MTPSLYIVGYNNNVVFYLTEVVGKMCFRPRGLVPFDSYTDGGHTTSTTRAFSLCSAAFFRDILCIYMRSRTAAHHSTQYLLTLHTGAPGILTAGLFCAQHKLVSILLLFTTAVTTTDVQIYILLIYTILLLRGRLNSLLVDQASFCKK